MSAPPPTPPAGAQSAPVPASPASPALRINTKESWARANAWLGSPAAAAASPGAAGEVKRLLGLATSQWEQPGQAAPTIVQACQLAGLDPVLGDEIVAQQIGRAHV